jgi:hypothetical protein
VIDFDDVRPATWRTLELILAAPALFEECMLAVQDIIGDDDIEPGDRSAQELERLLREIDDLARYEERPRLLEALASVRPLTAVQWEFVAETLKQIAFTRSVSPETSSWTEVVEEAFGD